MIFNNLGYKPPPLIPLGEYIGEYPFRITLLGADLSLRLLQVLGVEMLV
jgi:hypothetical protein